MTEPQARSWLDSESSAYTVTTDGHYLVSLAAKYAGLTDPHQTTANGSHTFWYSDIAVEAENLRNRFGSDVHTVRSTQFGKQGTNSNIPAGQYLYLTIYDPGTLSSLTQAESWCTSHFPELTGQSLDNVCLPRQATAPH